MSDNIYNAIIFWIDKKNKIFQFKNIKIEGIYKWKGGIPNFKFRAKIKIILKKLSLWKKYKFFY